MTVSPPSPTHSPSPISPFRQRRERDDDPPPQIALHVLHDSQFDHLGQGYKKYSVNIYCNIVISIVNRKSENG